MKVKLFQRQLYYKVGMIEIDVPNFLDPLDEVDEWLHNNEELWVDKLAESMDEGPLEHGFGMDSLTNRWSNHTEDCEYLYELPSGNGGHIY